MSRLKYALLVAALFGSTSVRAADAPPPQIKAVADAPRKVTSIEGVTEYRLPNGFRALLMPDDSKPQIHVHCTVLVGSRHEGYGEAGMAHLLEHMLCKGTARHPNIMKALRDRGARSNATTSVDRTNFFATLPASDDNLAFAIGLEADRLVNSVVKRDELITEMTVVRNEFEINENGAEGLLVERMTHAAYRWHNYGKTVLGNRADIEKVPVENLQAFYKKHYRVDNAVLVVTGKFDEAKALALIAKHFGPIPKPAQPLMPTYTQEPAQDGERQVVLRRVGSVGAVGATYHIPANAHPDYPALQVLAYCLTNEPGGRLYKALIEGKKATSVGGLALGRHDPGLLTVVARVEDAAGTDAARDTLIQTLESLADRPITEDEVARARTVIARIIDRTLTNPEAMADQLDETIALGDWRIIFWERDQTEKLTAADVNRVAAKYLTRNNRTVGVYYAAKKPERVDIPETTDLAKRLEGYTGRTAAAATQAFDPAPEKIEARVTRGQLGPIRTAFLPKPTKGDLVHLQLTLHYGNAEALAGRVTAAELVPSMLLAGTKTRTRQQITDELTRLEGGIAFGGGVGDLTMTVTAKKANMAATLALVRDVLRNPAFPPAEFDTIKAQVLTNLTARKTDPEALAGQAVSRKLRTYPKGDVRYKATVDETIASMKATTVADVKAVYTDLIGAGAGELAVVGAFDPAVVTAGLEPALAGWASKVEYRRVANPATPVGKGETIRIETPDKANATYLAILAFPMTDTDPDYPAMMIGSYILGGHSIESRLGLKVRKEKGLSYGVGADFTASPTDESAAFVLEASTNPANMRQVAETIAGELTAFLADGPTPAELAAAKRSFVEQMKLALSEDAVLADSLSNGLYLQRTFARQAALIKQIEALTPAAIQKAFRRVVDPAKLVIAEAGDFAKTDTRVGSRTER